MAVLRWIYRKLMYFVCVRGMDWKVKLQSWNLFSDKCTAFWLCIRRSSYWGFFLNRPEKLRPTCTSCLRIWVRSIHKLIDYLWSYPGHPTENVLALPLRTANTYFLDTDIVCMPITFRIDEYLIMRKHSFTVSECKRMNECGWCLAHVCAVICLNTRKLNT